MVYSFDKMQNRSDGSFDGNRAMTIILDNYEIPERGHVEVNLSFEIKVTAEEARRKVNRWLCEEVSYLMGADAPTLVAGQQTVWRVPTYITFPNTGRAGELGTVDVDVETGAMNNTTERKAEIEHRAEEIASQLPSKLLPREAPTAYIPEHIPPAAKLILPDDE